MREIERVDEAKCGDSLRLVEFTCAFVGHVQ